jgi:hypothetical protein
VQAITKLLGFDKTLRMVGEMLYASLPEEAVVVALDSLKKEHDRLRSAASTSLSM